MKKIFYFTKKILQILSQAFEHYFIVGNSTDDYKYFSDTYKIRKF